MQKARPRQFFFLKSLMHPDLINIPKSNTHPTLVNKTQIVFFGFKNQGFCNQI
jgi:hypothetical protein